MSEIDYKIDPTAFGLFLVAVVSLPLAVLQLKDEGVPTSGFFTLMGLLIILVSYIAYRNGSNFGFIVFGLVGAAACALAKVGLGGTIAVAAIGVAAALIIYRLSLRNPVTANNVNDHSEVKISIAKKGNGNDSHNGPTGGSQTPIPAGTAA